MKIHVYAISKNEEKHAERFLASCADADGVHVMDTGSDDRTPEILAASGIDFVTRIIDPWRFDRARMAALAMVPEDADICIPLDLDEILVPGWRKIIEDAWQPWTNLLDYLYAWEMRDGVPFRAWHQRKIHARKGFYWKAPCHEMIVPEPGIVISMAEVRTVLMEHYQDTGKSRAHYLPLMELGVQEDPRDARLQLYLGREYSYLCRWNDAITTLENYLAIGGTWAFERASACIMIANAHYDPRVRLRWFMRGVHEMDWQRETWVALSDHCRKVGDHAGSYWAAKKALDIPIGSRIDSYLNEPDCWTWRPHDNLAIAAHYLGRDADAEEHSLKALTYAPDDDRLIKNFHACRRTEAPGG